ATDPVAPATEDKSVPDFKATGKKEVIAGHNAEEWVGTADEGLMDVWVASDFPKSMANGYMDAMMSSSRSGPKAKRMMQQIFSKGQFFVRMSMTKDDGQKLISMEFVKAE